MERLYYVRGSNDSMMLRYQLFPNWPIDSVQSQSKFCHPFFLKNWQADSEVHIECKGPNAKAKATVKKRHRDGGLTLPNFMT